MIEGDHAEEPDPEPATPILASQLLDLEEKQRRRFTGNGGTEKLRTGCVEIDELLGGGIERGIVVGISADGFMGSLISLHVLATVLLAHQSLPRSRARTKAVVIDTTGSFPLSLLAKILRHRSVEERTAAATRSIETGNFTAAVPVPISESEVQDEVKRCLEMVALSRVFDIEGLWEVLGEVGRGKEYGEASVESPSSSQRDVRRGAEEESHEETAEVADSEEETTPIEEEKPTPQQPPMQRGEEEEGTEIIIIDNMTHIINELLARRAKADAHSLLTLLSQTLHSQSRTQNSLTILHNTLIPTTSALYPAQQQQQQAQQPLFPSATLKPSLGLTFTQFPHLHLSLTPLPRSIHDAEHLYGNTSPTPNSPIPNTHSHSEIKVNHTTILQILQDSTPSLGSDTQRKFGSREGAWCAIDTVDDVRLKGVFTEERRIESESVVDSRVGLGVGHVAKVFGFGGRRV